MGDFHISPLGFLIVEGVELHNWATCKSLTLKVVPKGIYFFKLTGDPTHLLIKLRMSR